jgi:putative transposase
MPSPPRILFPQYPVLITTRVEEGLPFICSQVMNLIIRSTLAKAQELYKVEVCHFLFMANHLHIILIVKSPDSVAAFMNYVKTETAHAINRLRNIRQKTVWVDGYDAVSILTPEDTIDKIAYIYANPQKANLVEKIDEYPGVSSWGMFTNDRLTTVVPRITRPSILPGCTVESLTEASLEKTSSFTLSPNAWMSLFKIKDSDFTDVNTKITDRVRSLESEYSVARARKNKGVLGAKRLQAQTIDKVYSPSKFSKRMWCICHDRELRRSFIDSIKNLIHSAKEVYKLWKKGYTDIRYPVGLFPPRFPRLVNLYWSPIRIT